MNRNWVETLVGAVVLLAAGLFLFTLIGKADLGKSSAKNFQAVFLNADGLTAGTDVRIAGVKVGRVTGQRLDTQTYDAIVEFDVNDGVEIPEDSSIAVLTDGLLGGNYLAIQPGGADGMLADGDRVKYTSDSINMIELISKAIFSATED
ncbi:MAG: outer membrane lipid asymmetry maintenance protein MlaD [Alphaproteobacteria bacterium]